MIGCRNDRKMAWCQTSSSRDQLIALGEVYTCTANMQAGRFGLDQCDGIPFTADILLHHHTVCTVRYDRAGKDADAFVFTEITLVRVPGGRFTDQLQRFTLYKIDITHGIAIHRGHV